MKKLLCLKSIILSCVCIQAKITLAETIEDVRQEMQTHYIEQSQNAFSVFASAPPGHIVPKKDTVTIAGSFGYLNATVGPKGKDITEGKENLLRELDLSGWSAVPYLAFSTKNFGLGLAGEIGNENISFKTRNSPQEEFWQQLGKVKYSGIGLNCYSILGVKYLPKFITWTLILGIRNLNVVHETTGNSLQKTSAVALYKDRYTVRKIEIGSDVGIELAKRFTVQPWFNYTKITINEEADNSENTYVVNNNSGVKSALEFDKDIVWRNAANARYGVDFILNLFEINIHLGGLFGLIDNYTKGSDRIYNNSISIGASYDVQL